MRRDLGRGGFVQGDQAREAHEVQHAEGRGVAGAAAGGHDVAGAGDVVAQHLKGMLAEEQAARVLDPRRPGPRVAHGQAQVLGGILVGQGHGLVQVARQHNARGALKGLGDDRGPFQRLDLPRHLGLHGPRQRLARCQQDGGGQHIVLGLGQQVGRHPGRVGVLVSHHHGFGRPGQAVDPYNPIHQLLGQGHVDVAGPHNLVDRLEAFGAIGQGRNRLRPAHPEHLRGAGDGGGGQDDGVHEAGIRVGGVGRRGHHDLGHAGDAGEHHGVEHGRRQRRGAAGDVAAHAAERRDHLAHQSAQFVRQPGVDRLAAVELLQAGRGDAQGCHHLRRDKVQRRGRVGDSPGVHGYAVEALGVGTHGGVALFAHGRQHRLHRLQVARVRVDGPAAQQAAVTELH